MATMLIGDFVLFCLLKTRKRTIWHSRGKNHTCTSRNPSKNRRPKRATNGTAVTRRIIIKTIRRRTWGTRITWPVILRTVIPRADTRQTRIIYTAIIGAKRDDPRRENWRTDTMKTKYQPCWKEEQSEARKDHKANENKVRHLFHRMLKRYAGTILKLCILYFGGQSLKKWLRLNSSGIPSLFPWILVKLGGEGSD